jgi:hypothetical protein
MFAIQGAVTAHQNYGVCLTPFGTDKVQISKNLEYNGRSGGATELASTTVTFTTGWYEVSIDWLSDGHINVTVYNNSGGVFATVSKVDTTYTSSGGVGFTFWGQHGGWDIPSARAYISSAPTATFGLEQQDSGATWKAAENTSPTSVSAGQNMRLRLTVRNSGALLADQQFRLQVVNLYQRGIIPMSRQVVLVAQVQHVWLQRLNIRISLLQHRCSPYPRVKHLHMVKS